MIIHEINTNPPFHSPQAGLHQLRAGLLEPLVIWKRDSDSCTCSCFQNPVWGWMLCSSSFLPWLWVVGSLSSPWCLPCLPGPRGTLDSCHIAGKRPVSVGITRQEEIGRSDRKVREGRGTRSSFFFPIFCPSSPAEPSHTRCESKARPEVLNPLSLLRDVTGRWTLMRLDVFPCWDWLTAPKDIWCNQILAVQRGQWWEKEHLSRVRGAFSSSILLPSQHMLLCWADIARVLTSLVPFLKFSYLWSASLEVED